MILFRMESPETQETLSTKHSTKTNKPHNTTQKFEKMSNTEPDNKYNYNNNEIVSHGTPIIE